MKMLSQIRIRCFFQFHTSMRSRLAKALAAKSIFLNLKQLLLSSLHLQQSIGRFQTQRWKERELGVGWHLCANSMQVLLVPSRHPPPGPWPVRGLANDSRRSGL